MSYVMVRLMRQLAQGENFDECGGWYDDELVETADGWRIKVRAYGSNWWRGNPAVGGNGFDPASGHAAGGRGRRDRPVEILCPRLKHAKTRVRRMAPTLYAWGEVRWPD